MRPRRFVVRVQERLHGLRLPLARGKNDLLVRIARPLGQRVEQRGMHRVVERAQHSGHVLQRRMLPPPFLERSRRLAFEIGDDEVVLRDQHLSQMIVAVQAGLRAGGRVRGMAADPRKQCVAPREQVVGIGARGIGQRVTPAREPLEHGDRPRRAGVASTRRHRSP